MAWYHEGEGKDANEARRKIVRDIGKSVLRKAKGRRKVSQTGLGDHLVGVPRNISRSRLGMVKQGQGYGKERNRKPSSEWMGAAPDQLRSRISACACGSEYKPPACESSTTIVEGVPMIDQAGSRWMDYVDA